MGQVARKFKYLGILVYALVMVNFIYFGTAVGAEKEFPIRPVELIVPTPPGGGVDILSRFLADAVEPLFGQRLVVINKPGGSGTLGINMIIKAKPDGYTLGCLWPAPLTMVPYLMKISYTVEDLSYITLLTRGLSMFCVRSEFPAKNAGEFFEYARRNPGKLAYASDGIGGAFHFIGERVFQAMGVKLRPVPYSGAGESLKALLGGHVEVAGLSFSTAAPHMKAGTVRAIFLTRKERVKELPEVASISDLGHPEIEAGGVWRGIVGPKGIPADRFAILEKAFRQAVQTDKMRGNVEKLGETVEASSGKEFENIVRLEAAENAIIAKQIGLTPK